jgi:hypothetical protein
MIVNCTKQDILVINHEGRQYHIEPSGIMPWLEVEKQRVLDIEVAQGLVVPVYRERLVSMQNVPDPEDGTYYVVSAKVADFLPEREDFIVPNLLKDVGGRALGVTSFRQRKVIDSEEDYYNGE